MQLSAFQNTCTARIMYGFGQSDTAISGRGQNFPKETMFAKCRELLQQAGREGAATVIAIIDNQQTTAAEVLPQLGFVCVQRDLAKHKHPEKKISTYVYTVCDADRVALPVPVNPWETPEARREREEEAARVAEQEQAVAVARVLRARRLQGVDDARRNGVDYNNLPAPRGRNRDLEDTPLYQALKAALAEEPDTWKKCRRNLRVLFENHSWTFINGPQLGEGQDRSDWLGKDAHSLNRAFDWEFTPQGDNFWRGISRRAAIVE